METEERRTQINYAKALNRIVELEQDVIKLNRNNNELRKELATKDKQIDELESEVEDLKSQIEDRAMFTPNRGMSLIELMEIEEMIGEVTFT